mmetsp:Transcript_3382/g.9536  ORF Transcript_3382/g.9536 Transcript_3382/m.9536 type:complete len:226 (+) Transcript_3382:183-860(+)
MTPGAASATARTAETPAPRGCARRASTTACASRACRRPMPTGGAAAPRRTRGSSASGGGAPRTAPAPGTAMAAAGSARATLATAGRTAASRMRPCTPFSSVSTSRWCGASGGTARAAVTCFPSTTRCSRWTRQRSSGSWTRARPRAPTARCACGARCSASWRRSGPGGTRATRPSSRATSSGPTWEVLASPPCCPTPWRCPQPVVPSLESRSPCSRLRQASMSMR